MEKPMHAAPRVRRIEPMQLPKLLTPAAVSGMKPKLRWVKPTHLYVDETYQRDLSRKSMSLIWQLCEHFAWNRMKPPIVVETPRGLHIIDGQHTAIAAATIGIPEIPIFIVEAEALAERARAFVGHNTDRITVTPIAIYNALRAAGDPDALDVENVCRRAKVRIRTINQASAVAEGDTMAIGTIRALIERRGVMKARLVLEALVVAKRAPISTAEIVAADYLICRRSPGLAGETVARLFRILGDAGLQTARARARKEKIPIWRAIVEKVDRPIERRAAS